MRVGINGMGRMGRLALRAAMGGVHRPADDPRRDNRLDVVHVNEIKGGAAATAHLLEFDSIHGRWHSSFEVDGERGIAVGGKYLGFSAGTSPGDVAWGDLGCDIVLECTGKFLKPEQLNSYFQRGVKRVIVAAPVKDDRALNVVVGVNDRLYEPERHRLLTAASCTTNCLAPVVKVVHEAIGIAHGQITTIHAPTNTNVVVDSPHKDLRRARSAGQNIIPTTTGAARALSLVIPELKGKFDGFALRVPTPTVSVIDFVAVTERPVTAESANDALREAAEGPMQGLLGYTEEPLVSMDFKGDPRSSIIDAASTMVTGERMVKVIAWYDNEWGYSCRVADLAAFMAERL
jgi:glyceraldehyde 3-phosphate dehydrogenase